MYASNIAPNIALNLLYELPLIRLSHNRCDHVLPSSCLCVTKGLKNYYLFRIAGRG